ncbi:hypothetical protein V8G54_002728 [Vigna mungo]|uniref:Uncharacterized protein n=1 Tax=Vigna mungo TaxID=3915 RepID=A0AAQ3SDB1_VIGMU
MEFSSEGKGVIQSNEQAQQLGKLLYGSMEEETKLKDKVDEIENGYKEEVAEERKGRQELGAVKMLIAGHVRILRPQSLSHYFLSTGSDVIRAEKNGYYHTICLCPPFEYS